MKKTRTSIFLLESGYRVESNKIYYVLIQSFKRSGTIYFLSSTFGYSSLLCDLFSYRYMLGIMPFFRRSDLLRYRKRKRTKKEDPDTQNGSLKDSAGWERLHDPFVSDFPWLVGIFSS